MGRGQRAGRTLMSHAQLSHWYVQAPTLILAALSYVLIARFLLEIAWRGKGDNIVLRVLRGTTGPIVRPVAAITPRLVPATLVIGCAVVWIFALRIVLVQILAIMAMRRMLG